EIIPGAPIYSAGSAIRALTFSPDGRRLAAQESVWEVTERQGRRLNPLRIATEAPNANYLASGGRVWAVESQSGFQAPKPVKLREVSFESRELVLAGVKRTEGGEIVNASASPDGHYLLLGWRRFVPVVAHPGTFSYQSQLELWDLKVPRRLSIWE